MAARTGVISAGVLIAALSATIYHWDKRQFSLSNSTPAQSPPLSNTNELIPSLSKMLSANNITAEPQQIDSYSADSTVSQQASINVPPEVIEMIKECYSHGYQGNTEYAALLAIEAAEKSISNPSLSAQMRYMAGQYYEKLKYLQMAKQQYALALLMLPEHQNSYRAMRRLDPIFASENPPLSGDKTSARSSAPQTSKGALP